jgi:hypothetical protein
MEKAEITVEDPLNAGIKAVTVGRTISRIRVRKGE